MGGGDLVMLVVLVEGGGATVLHAMFCGSF